MTEGAIVARALRQGRIAGGLVLCDLCDNPASLQLSLVLGWTACAPCAWGEADSFDNEDVIPVEEQPSNARNPKAESTRPGPRVS
jgi:hypothetical protein